MKCEYREEVLAYGRNVPDVLQADVDLFPVNISSELQLCLHCSFAFGTDFITSGRCNSVVLIEMFVGLENVSSVGDVACCTIIYVTVLVVP